MVDAGEDPWAESRAWPWWACFRTEPLRSEPDDCCRERASRGSSGKGMLRARGDARPGVLFECAPPAPDPPGGCGVDVLLPIRRPCDCTCTAGLSPSLRALRLWTIGQRWGGKESPR